ISPGRVASQVDARVRSASHRSTSATAYRIDRDTRMKRGPRPAFILSCASVETLKPRNSAVCLGVRSFCTKDLHQVRTDRNDGGQLDAIQSRCGGVVSRTFRRSYFFLGSVQNGFSLTRPSRISLINLLQVSTLGRH